MNRVMGRMVEEDKGLWIPDWLEGPPDPPEGKTPEDDRRVHVNLVPGEIEVADEGVMRLEIERFGRVGEEPEIGRARDLGLIPSIKDPGGLPEPSHLNGLLAVEAEAKMGVLGYTDTYWTHFDYRADTARQVVRTQKKYPHKTYCCTYFCHPPVYGRKYEFVSFDVWQGGMVGGRYTGYRGKPLDPVLGRQVFNTIFYDEHDPPIYWIIYEGRMWTRGYGWGPAPGGPPDSDPGHYRHIHVTNMLYY